MKDLRMCIHFGFAGYQGSTAPAEAYEKIKYLIHEFLEEAKKYNSHTYGFTGETVRCDLFTGDLFFTQGIRDYSRENGIPLTLVTSAADSLPDKQTADHVIALDISRTNLSYPNITAEYVVNQSDVVFLLWDGNQNFQEGPLWTVLQLCKQKHIPYYLINTRKLEDVSFSSDSYYVPYSSQFVRNYVAELYCYEKKEPLKKRIPLSRLWLRIYNKFIGKHSMNPPSESTVSDQLLKEDYFPADHISAGNHRLLAEHYSYYNRKAGEVSKLYKASIYFRSILPLTAMLLLAIGTHTENLARQLLHMDIHSFSYWSWVAAMGFLLHAMVNLYAYRTEKNPAVDRLRQDFIESRFIAEYLRILIHGEAYGIQLDNVCMDTPLVDKHVLAKLHHILRMQEPLTYVQTREVMDEAVGNFQSFVNSQQDYHAFNVRRYKSMYQTLSELSNKLFGLSFAVLLCSFLLQPLLSLFKDQGNYIALTKTLTDIAAMVFPALASYASSKLTRNNFEWLYRNSESMLEGYGSIQEKLDEICRRKNNTCQIMNDIATDIMQHCQNDFTNWYLRTGSQTFTRL